ncbi:hypothetical protein ACFQX7_13350 [Luedemannella flava]
MSNGSRGPGTCGGAWVGGGDGSADGQAGVGRGPASDGETCRAALVGPCHRGATGGADVAPDGAEAAGGAEPAGGAEAAGVPRPPGAPT